jgi:hypothetical protein
VGAASADNAGTAVSVNLTGLAGNELIFDNVFAGVSATDTTMSVGSGQTQRWLVNGYTSSATSFNTMAGASTKQASGTSATMTWTMSASAWWATVAVPIKPAPTGPTYNLTMAVSPSGGGTTDPSVGVHAAAQGSTVAITAIPASGYVFSSWSGAVTGSTNPTTVSMTANRSVTANFTVAPVVVTFTGAEFLGQPTDTSVAVKAMPDTAVTLRCQYSTTSGSGYSNTSTVAATAGQPATVNITGLTANTKYYYRLQYSTDSGSTWTSRPENSFYTKRAAGSTFTFDITSDSHIGIQLGTESNWQDTLDKVAADKPDFMIDLGDTVAMDDGSSSVAGSAAAEQVYKDALPYFNTVSAGSPLFMVAGNHEQQEAWHGTSASSLPIIGKNAEKKFFLNPLNNSFYSGDTATQANLTGDQTKQDYYAWTWGDALFVVINPYWYSTTKPYTTTVGGGETDTTGSGNRWDWTLGQAQFNWLKTTLANSTAKYKFVFSHQIVGSNAASGQENYGHGGVDAADFCEWGGFNVGTTTMAFTTNRSGWGSEPIRQMMKTNGVSAFFHGHDHQMAYEKYDGIVYQSSPSGSFSGSFGMYTTGGNSGNTIYADTNQGPGYLKVTVSPTNTTVDFIRYNGSSAAYSYTIAPAAQSTFNLNLATGWNLVAATPGATFPSSLFGWTGSAYQSATSATAWNGYWCKASGASVVAVTPATGPHTVNLTTGWNLIGNSMAQTATLTVPLGRSVFVYDTASKSYVSTLSLAPGQGAWVKGTSGETVVLTGS